MHTLDYNLVIVRALVPDASPAPGANELLGPPTAASLAPAANDARGPGLAANEPRGPAPGAANELLGAPVAADSRREPFGADDTYGAKSGASLPVP